MAAGVPVLASRRGGLPEMVGAEHVLPDRDLGAWADAMGSSGPIRSCAVPAAEEALSARGTCSVRTASTLR